MARRDFPIREQQILVSRAFDWDGDGDLDIMSASQREGTNRLVWIENVDGIFRSRASTVVEGELADVAAIDIDGDGDLDPIFMTFTRSAGAIWYLENQHGPPRVGAQTLISEDGGQGANGRRRFGWRWAG